MKKINILFIVVILFTGCADKRYLLTDQGKNKYFLAETIRKQRKNGVISSTPILVIDGVPHRYNVELKKHQLTFAKRNIKRIDILKKDKAIIIYGTEGKKGVILVSTRRK